MANGKLLLPNERERLQQELDAYGDIEPLPARPLIDGRLLSPAERESLEGELNALDKDATIQPGIEAIMELEEIVVSPTDGPIGGHPYLVPLSNRDRLYDTEQYYSQDNVWGSPAAYSRPPTLQSWQPHPLSEMLFIRESVRSAWDDTISANIMRNLNAKIARGEIESLSEYFDQWRTGDPNTDWTVDVVERWFDFYSSEYRDALDIDPLILQTLPEGAGKTFTHGEAKEYITKHLGEDAEIEIPSGKVHQDYLDIVIAANQQQQYIDLLTQLSNPGPVAIGKSILFSLFPYTFDPAESLAQFPALTPYFHQMMGVGPPVTGPGGRWRKKTARAIFRHWDRWWRGFHPSSVGASVAEPFAIFAAEQEQIDYGVGDSLMNILAGGAVGGALHVGIGTIGDLTVLPASLRTGRTASLRSSAPGARYVDTLTPDERMQIAGQVGLQAERGQRIDISPTVLQGLERAPPSIRLGTFLDADRAIRQSALPSDIAGNYAQAVNDIRLRSQQALFNLAQAGETAEDGFASPVLQAAQVARSRGGLRDFQTFQKFADDVIHADRQNVAVRQDAIQNVIERYAPSEIAPGERVVAKGIGPGTVISRTKDGHLIRFDPGVPAPSTRIIKPSQKQPFPLYRPDEYPRFDTIRGKYQPEFTDEDIIKQVETLTNAEPAGPITRSDYTQSVERVEARGRISDEDIMNEVIEELDRIGLDNLPPAVRADVEQANKDIALANEHADATMAGADCLATRGK